MEEVVPLNKLPYKARAAGFSYEFRCNFNGNGLYSRHQIGGSLFNGKFPDDTKEQLRFYFTLDPVDYTELVHPMRPIFANPERSLFLKTPFLFRYTEFTDEHYQFIIICGNNVLVAGRETRHVEKYSNSEPIRSMISKYFPDLDKIVTEAAFNVFKSFASTQTSPPV